MFSANVMKFLLYPVFPLFSLLISDWLRRAGFPHFVRQLCRARPANAVLGSWPAAVSDVTVLINYGTLEL